MRAIVLAAFVLCVGASGLVDDPFLSDLARVSLNGDWGVANGAGINVTGSVPGDLLSDLEAAGKINDPLFDMNFQSKLWDATEWTYTKHFKFNSSVSSEVYLVFDGLKMAANIELNGVLLASARDQFLRYYLPVSTHLQPQNVLTVTFLVSMNAANHEGRWMGCSGAWDWAPYGTTFTQEGDHTFSKGIVKDVYIVPVANVALSNLGIKTYFKGAYPTSPLQSTAGPFDVVVEADLLAPHAQSVNLTVKSTFGNASITVSVPGGGAAARVNVTIPVVSATLWWPSGLGAQTLYNVTVEVEEAGKTLFSTVRRVGFRVVSLVTADDTNPDSLKDSDGSGNLTMRFRVNGANVHVRGANMIPMEEMEGRQSSSAFQQLLHSARDANMNLLRVWGGGVFLPSVFYDTCDELGLMVFHDLMYGTPWFGGQGGVPSDTPMQAQEIDYNVVRLSHHPSIIVWNGCNECQRPKQDPVYQAFALPALARADDSRPVWPSSPSRGFSSGVETLTGLPNGKPLVIRYDGPTIETHGPYQHGSGFKTRNGKGPLTPFDPKIPAPLSDPSTPYGIHKAGTFATEFGCSVFSSFESMSPTLKESDWAAHSAPMFERNYPCDSIIDMYFGTRNFSGVGSATELQKVTYLCMLGQALVLKSDIENRRTENAWGCVPWQLNEIWPTGGWGGVEYGTVGHTAGQVLGGRWKPIHHWYADHLFNDVIGICGKGGHCVVKNDNSVAPFKGSYAIHILRLNGSSHVVTEGDISLPIGGNAAHWFCMKTNSKGCVAFADLLGEHGCHKDASDCYFQMTISNEQGKIVDDNVILAAVPHALHLEDATVRVTFGSPRADGSVPVEVHSDNTAMFVTLTTQAQGRFSRNVFAVPAGRTKAIAFLPFGTLDMAKLKSTTRVDHVAMYR